MVKGGHRTQRPALRSLLVSGDNGLPLEVLSALNLKNLAFVAIRLPHITNEELLLLSDEAYGLRHFCVDVDHSVVNRSSFLRIIRKHMPTLISFRLRSNTHKTSDASAPTTFSSSISEKDLPRRLRNLEVASHLVYPAELLQFIQFCEDIKNIEYYLPISEAAAVLDILCASFPALPVQGLNLCLRWYGIDEYDQTQTRARLSKRQSQVMEGLWNMYGISTRRGWARTLDVGQHGFATFTASPDEKDEEFDMRPRPLSPDSWQELKNSMPDWDGKPLKIDAYS